ncbi:MAG TPA: hypothetical protein VJX67_25565 [Blastocatellia bacterium]|nr:hypothetical protein [Blastocatellia bacterium]
MASTRILLDPWPAEYESPIQIGDPGESDEDVCDVDTAVEACAWEPIAPARQPRPEPIYFVDGVRRVEARIILDDQSGRLIRGLFGSVAVGAVRVEAKHAEFDEIRVMRHIVTGSGASTDAQSVEIGSRPGAGDRPGELVFQPHSTAETDPAAPLRALQNLMRTYEAYLAEMLASRSECVFADGPLSYFVSVNLPAIGIVKRLFKPYLPLDKFGLVARLQAGQRTPLFAITDGKYDRYSWYLRVARPRALDHAISGVVRLEVRAGVGISTARAFANVSAACIPAFVADPFRDPRSPQNLLPVGALERELRHRLGDPLAIRRAIEKSLFRMSEA